MAGHSSQADLLRKWGFRLNRRLGQHFLVDQRVLARIVDLVREMAVESVVELGAGAGALTSALLEAGLKVVALELDARMVDLLRGELPAEKLSVRRVDIAREDLAKYVGEEPMCFVGNLPYQVTSPVLFGLLEALQRPSCQGALLMMQAEVAKRLCATPPSRDWGVLGVLISARCHLRRRLTVRPGSFLPPPKVQSAVVELRPRENPVDLGESGTRLVKDLFSERRKQVGGLLKRRYSLTDSQLAEMTASTGIDPRRRPEELSLEDFQRLDLWLGGGRKPQ